MAMIAADPVAAPTPASPPPPAVPTPAAAASSTPPPAQPALTPTVASAPPESTEPDIVDKIGTLSPDQRKYFFSQMNDDQKTRFQQILQQKIAAKHTPSAPTPSLHERFQSAADQMVNQPYLTDESGKPLNGTGYNTGAVGQAERFGMGVMRGGESVLVHPIQTAHSSVEMMRDVARATGSSSEVAGRDPNDPEVKKIVQDARDRLSAQWHQAGENPAETAGNFVGGGIVSEGLARLPSGAASTVRAGINAVRGTGEALTSAADLGTGTVGALRKAGESAIAEQTKADDLNEARQRTFEKQVQKAKQAATDKNQAALDKHNSLSEADKLKHDTDVARITAENDANEKSASDLNDVNRAEAQRKYQENVQAAADTESERGELARQEIQTRLRLQRRAQTIAKQAKGTVDSQFNEVRKAVGDEQAPTDSLAAVVEGAKKSELKGSSTKIPVFEDMLRRAKVDGAQDTLRSDVMQSQGFQGEYEKLSDGQRQTVDQIVDKINEQTGAEPEEPPTMGFDHWRGYSSELGKILQNHELDGDIRQAVKRVKSHVDAVAQKMADDAGVGEKLRSAKKNWSTYKDVFHEASGPSGSGSPVAKSLNAEDATNATEPFLSKDAEIANRARQMLVGKPFEGPYYDKNAGYLVDKLRDIRSRVEGLPKKPEEVAPYEEPKQVVAKEKPLPEPPAARVPPKPVSPQDIEPPRIKPDAEPVDIRQVKLESYQRAADNLKYLNKWQVRGLLGVGGGIIGHLLGAGERSSVAAGAVSAFGPMIIGKLIDTPTFRDFISKPRPRDFELLSKLKNADKARVRDGITGQIVNMADAGEQIKVSPEMQAFVGPENILKIAKSISRAKRVPAGGAERLKEAAAQAARGAFTGVGAASAVAAGTQRVETGTSEGAPAQ